MSHIVHYWKEADLRCSHDGLTLVAKKARYNPEMLENGQFLLFVNARQTMAKVLGPGGVLLHLKSSTGKLELRTLRYLPEMFSGKTFTYDDALSKVITKDFARRKKA